MWPVEKQIANYNVEEVIEESDMNGSHIYKTSNRSYVNTKSGKIPDVGDIVSYAYRGYKFDDGYAPVEIHHVKVLEVLSDEKYRGIPVDKQDVKCKDEYSLKANRWHEPIYEE